MPYYSQSKWSEQCEIMKAEYMKEKTRYAMKKKLIMMKANAAMKIKLGGLLGKPKEPPSNPPVEKME